MENPIRTAGIIIFKDSKILLVKHSGESSHMDGKYGIPAGRVNDSESEIDAAIRELSEETGLKADKDKLIIIPKTYAADIQRKDGTKRFSLKVFLCTDFSGIIRSSDETVPEWIKIKDIKRLDLLPNVEKIIEDSLAVSGIEYL